MTTIENPHIATLAAGKRTPRVVSIDIFRGLTIAVMIFVNELSGVKGLPWWTYHAHANEDVMTYVDMVFPFFLFIVGMSLPLSVAQRLKRSPSQVALWLHVVLRSLGLLVLGLILANGERGDAARMGISGSLWALLAIISAALYLNTYAESKSWPGYCTVLRMVGLAGVAVLFVLFRRPAPGGGFAWIDFSYPEILGLIAISYLAAAILYIPTRRLSWAPPVWLGLLVALCSFSSAKMLMFPQHLSLYVWPFGNGAMPALIMAGTITTSIFFRPGREINPRRAMTIAAGFAVLALVAGFALTPLGISKIRATPTWTLYSIGAAVLAYTLLYWICDVKSWTRWALLVRPAGSNTLLTYLLPDLWYFLLASAGITILDAHFNMGWPGVVKTLAFTFFMLALSAILTKAKLRLQL